MIIKQNGSQSVPHVPFDIVSEHAQEHMSPNTIGEMVMNRTNLQIDGFHTTKGTLDGGTDFYSGKRFVRRMRLPFSLRFG